MQDIIFGLGRCENHSVQIPKLVSRAFKQREVESNLFSAGRRARKIQEHSSAYDLSARVHGGVSLNRCGNFIRQARAGQILGQCEPQQQKVAAAQASGLPEHAVPVGTGLGYQFRDIANPAEPLP